MVDEEQDPELKRAKDLLKYHYEVKEAHKRGEVGRGPDQNSSRQLPAKYFAEDGVRLLISIISA